MQKLVEFIHQENASWHDKEKMTIEQAALDVGKAFARDINHDMEQFVRLTEKLKAVGEEVELVKIEPDVAFLKVFGQPVNFVRKNKPADGSNWGLVVSRYDIWVYKNAPAFSTNEFSSTVHSRPQFSVHELAHAFENVVNAVLGGKKGRYSIPSNLLNRDNGFFQMKRYQQSPDLGRGEIFADMFIGWVYDIWETVDGTPKGPRTEAGLTRKSFMDFIMIDLIRGVITKQ